MLWMIPNLGDKDQNAEGSDPCLPADRQQKLSKELQLVNKKYFEIKEHGKGKRDEPF